MHRIAVLHGDWLPWKTCSLQPLKQGTGLIGNISVKGRHLFQNEAANNFGVTGFSELMHATSLATAGLYYVTVGTVQGLCDEFLGDQMP